MTGDAAGPPLVIESFLVTNGRMLGRDRHRDRFLSAIGEIRPASLPDAEEGWPRGALEVPDGPRWFPRYELRGDGTLHWWWRPVPDTAAELVVSPAPVTDGRQYPHVKGYELAWLTAVRAGGPDVVLVGDDGLVRETTTAALLAWRDGHPVVPDGPGLASTTLAWFEEERGSAVRRVPLTFDDLMAPGTEVWALNAGHGFRRVRLGASAGSDPVPENQLAAWQARWLGAHRELP